MEIKTLDERIRERGVAEWNHEVVAVHRIVNEIASHGLRDERMEINGTQVMLIGACIDRLFQAIMAAGAKQAGDQAVAEFLQRLDQLGDEMEELRANQNT